MDRIVWKNEMSVGVEKLDLEHQHILGIINELKDAIANNITGELTGVILSELILYMKYHFKTEELYLKMYKPKDLAKHKLGHKHIGRRLADMKKEFKSGKDVSIKLDRLLTANFERHLKREDKDLANTMIEHTQ
jgi:hemerythrin